MKPSRKEAIEAIRTLIAYIGDDPNRSGLLQTPDRVLKAWDEAWGIGYHDPSFTLTLFENDETPIYDQMIFMRDISFHSTCEHHMVNFSGTASIAYIPKDKVVGLSKLPRIVNHFASRLQVQERLVGEIADFICQNISPDCAVSLEAMHLCMASRGVRQPKSTTVTTALRGIFKVDASAQSEFLSQVRAK